MSDQSCCQPDETLVFTCAGAAYVGQLANRIGVELTKKGVANHLCIASMAAGITDKLERAGKASRRIAIDGCEDHCCRIIMEKANLPLDHHVVMTELGIEKKPKEPQFSIHTKQMVEHVETMLA
jgi:uncharacterized metal-binding protein